MSTSRAKLAFFLLPFCYAGVLAAQVQLTGTTNGSVTFSGAVSTTAGTTLNISDGPSTFVSIYVLFPPQIGNNNTNLKASVMIQPAIDGVNVAVPWDLVEPNATPPNTTPCGPTDTPDTCQQDPVATSYYHHYTWAAIDGMGCGDTSTGSISQWFCDFPSANGMGVYKKVAIQLHGISQNTVSGGTGYYNSYTPAYVTQTWWQTAVGATAAQDVVNNISTLSGGTMSCGNYAGTISNGALSSANFTASADGNTITESVVDVTGILNTGDVVWIKGFSTAGFNVSGQAGAPITLLPNGLGGFNFSYPSSVSASGILGWNSVGNAIIKAVDSWPVPYETPYSSAYQALLSATIYHLNHLSEPIVTGGAKVAVSDRIAYFRPSVARGGEAIPICTNRVPLSNSTPPFGASTNTLIWNAWYEQIAKTVQAASPLMPVLFSLSAGDPAFPDANFAADQASRLQTYATARGDYFGFGSQGLAYLDKTGFVVGNCPDGSGAPDTGNNWGCMFGKYWSGANATLYATTMDTPSPSNDPLELQQIDCSNPDSSFSSSNPGSCFQGGWPGKTLDLTVLYPFTVGQNVRILELYSQDALLAFDPLYCKLPTSGTNCDIAPAHGGDGFGGALGSDVQYDFFNKVGIGTACSGTYAGVVAQAGATVSACGYANSLTNSIHGLQPH